MKYMKYKKYPKLKNDEGGQISYFLMLLILTAIKFQFKYIQVKVWPYLEEKKDYNHVIVEMNT